MACITLLIGLIIILFKLSSKENIFNAKRKNDSIYDKMLYYRVWIVIVLLTAISLIALLSSFVNFIKYRNLQLLLLYNPGGKG